MTTPVMTTPAPLPARAFALIGWVVTVTGTVAAIGLRIADPAPVLPNVFGFGDLALTGLAAMGVAFASVGALLVVRRPANSVGWLMVIVGLCYGLSNLTAAGTFSAAALGTATGDRLAAFTGWLTVILTTIGGLIWLLPLIFPTGRGHTRTWDRVVRGFVPLMGLMTIAYAVQPGPLHLFETIDNPFGMGPDLRPVLGVSLSNLIASGAVAAGPLVLVSIVSRYRAAGAIERQQLKWTIYASVVSIAGVSIAAGGAALTSEPPGEAGLAVFGWAGALIPVAIGIAILRNHLYDIDRLISRTLGYALITVALAGIYGLAVIAFGAVLSSVAEGEAIAVAASTLVMAASFGTVRRRAQRILDRRFNRAHYDADRAVAAFAERLRDEMDLAVLGSDIHAVIERTVAPSRVALWLRSPAR